MSFHEGTEKLEEYRYEEKQLSAWPRASHQRTTELFLLDSRRISADSTEDESKEKENLFQRFYRRWEGEKERREERLIELLPSNPDRLIESLIRQGDFGEALRVCHVFHREEFSDEIHEKQIRQSSSQLKSHLTKIRSRLRVLQLCTTLIYPTLDEQLLLLDFALQQATKKSFFLRLSQSDQLFFQSISEENLLEANSSSSVVKENSTLTIPQKQLLLYRRKLLDQRRKVILIDDLIHQSHLFDQFQPELLEKFRSWDFVEIGQRVAREGHLDALRLVLDHARPEIRGKDLLTILSSLPEEIPLAKFSALIPKIGEKTRIRREKNELDWTDEFLTETNDDEERNELNEDELARWFDERIRQCEANGFVLNALDLCDFALQVDELLRFEPTRKFLHLEFLFNSFTDESLTFDQLETMSDEEILRLIFNPSENVEKRFDEVFLPAAKDFLRSNSNDLFLRIFVEQVQKNVDMFPLLRLFKGKDLFDKTQLDQFVRAIIFNLTSVEQMPIGQRLLTLTDRKSDLDHLIAFVHFVSSRRQSPHRQSFSSLQIGANLSEVEREDAARRRPTHFRSFDSLRHSSSTKFCSLSFEGK